MPQGCINLLNAPLTLFWLVLGFVFHKSEQRPHNLHVTFLCDIVILASELSKGHNGIDTQSHMTSSPHMLVQTKDIILTEHKQWCIKEGTHSVHTWATFQAQSPSLDLKMRHTKLLCSVLNCFGVDAYPWWLIIHEDIICQVHDNTCPSILNWHKHNQSVTIQDVLVSSVAHGPQGPWLSHVPCTSRAVPDMHINMF